MRRAVQPITCRSNPQPRVRVQLSAAVAVALCDRAPALIRLLPVLVAGVQWQLHARWRSWKTGFAARGARYQETVSRRVVGAPAAKPETTFRLAKWPPADASSQAD
jgi:hypothetical protein